MKSLTTTNNTYQCVAAKHDTFYIWNIAIFKYKIEGDHKNMFISTRSMLHIIYIFAQIVPHFYFWSMMMIKKCKNTINDIYQCNDAKYTCYIACFLTSWEMAIQSTLVNTEYTLLAGKIFFTYKDIFNLSLDNALLSAKHTFSNEFHVVQGPIETTMNEPCQISDAPAREVFKKWHLKIINM